MAGRITWRRLTVLATTAVAVLSVLIQPLPAAASANGTLFALNIRTPNVSRVDPTTGALTPLVDLSLPAGQPAPGFSSSMANDPATHRLFLVRVKVTFVPTFTTTDELVTVDTKTGALTVSPALSHPVTALAFDPPAVLGLTGDCCPNQIVRIDPATGAFTHVADVTGNSFSFMAVNPATHSLYLASETFAFPSPPTNVMLTVNTLTGAVSQSPNLTIGIRGPVYDTSLGALFGITFGGAPPFGPPHLVRVDPTTGVETTIGSYNFGFFLEPGIAIDSVSHTIFVVQDVFDPLTGPIAHIASINDQTGAGVLGASTGTNIAALAFEPAPPPPPGGCDQQGDNNGNFDCQQSK